MTHFPARPERAGMDDQKRREIIAPVIAALLAALLAAYVIAYFQLGNLGTANVPGSPPATVRVYRSQWQANLFTPGIIIESWIRGEAISTAHRQ